MSKKTTKDSTDEIIIDFQKKYQFTSGVKNLREKLSSEQFLFSEQIIDKRFELNVSFEKMAEITKTTPQEYIKLEYGDLSVPISTYEKAMELIVSYQKSKST